MRVDEAAAGDIPAVVLLMNAAYRGGEPDRWNSEAGLIGGERIAADQLAADLAAFPGGRLLIVRVKNGGVTGSVWLRPLSDGVWYLGSLTIAPERQGGGLGSRLLTAAERWIAERGAKVVRISVIAARRALIEWYERRGYRVTGEEEPWPDGDHRFGVPLRPLHFAFLEKRLGSVPAPG